MKRLIIVTLVPLLFACNDKYVLQANLCMVGDNKEIRRDEMDNVFNIRCLSIHYLAINTSNDSIFIPIGYPYEKTVIANIESRDLFYQPYQLYRCNKFNGSAQQYFAPGDSISITFLFAIYPKNSTDSEWLRNVSTKELMSKMELKLVKPTNGKNIDKIPNIIFNNDTNDICINPVISVQDSDQKMDYESIKHN